MIRLAQKIQEEEDKRSLKDGGGYQYISDILRARIIAEDVEDLKNKLTIFESIPGVKIIRYKPKFFGVNQADLRNVNINFVWSNSFICEL